jgi:ABC-2 type transport system permease protein
MTGAALALHQYRYDQKQFWREPASVFFTVALPLIFLVLFVAIFGNDTTTVGGNEIPSATYYVPAILTLALLNATFVNLTIWLTINRERGQLKRVRATPAPAWVVIAGRALTSLAVAAVMVVVVCAFGVVFYGVDLPGDTAPAAVLMIVVGTLSLSALGFAAAALVPSENAAPPVANVLVLPLEFISGIFVPSEQIPAWMNSLAGVFPVKPLFDGILTAFDPNTTGVGIDWGNVGVLVAWGVGGLILALRFFRWEPRTGR